MLLGAEQMNRNIAPKTSGDLLHQPDEPVMKRDDPMRLGDYEVHKAWEGFTSIRQVSSGEIMHSRTDPMEEARKLYVEQSRLGERLRAGAPVSDPLIIWDVGLGGAANAMAAIECYESVSGAGPLQIISFENDLDSLRLAVSRIEDFPYLRAEPAKAILSHGEWRSPDQQLSWKLFFGDLLDTMTHAPGPDLIFYDMFSTKTSAALWTLSTFRQLFAACAGRAVELFTYTCSTANRAALLAAGFFVARGRNAGEKVETTIALTPAALSSPRESHREFLTLAWLAKWNRSAAKFPSDVTLEQQAEFEKIIREHEQFRNSPAQERLHSTT
jgi:queuine tRNA-ribosyltransferase